jgi:hypothetical protein
MLFNHLHGFSFEHISRPLAFTVTGTSHNQHEHDSSDLPTTNNGDTRSLTYTYLSWTHHNPSRDHNNILERLCYSIWTLAV